MEEASVAGESPDRSKQRESSAEPTPRSAGSVPEARDPRLAVAREKDSSAGGTDTATKVLTVRSEGPAGAEEAGTSGEDPELRAAVSAWVRDPAADATAKPAETQTSAGAEGSAKEKAGPGSSSGADEGAGEAGGAETGAKVDAGPHTAADAGSDGADEDDTDADPKDEREAEDAAKSGADAGADAGSGTRAKSTDTNAKTGAGAGGKSGAAAKGASGAGAARKGAAAAKRPAGAGARGKSGAVAKPADAKGPAGAGADAKSGAGAKTTSGAGAAAKGAPAAETPADAATAKGAVGKSAPATEPTAAEGKAGTKAAAGAGTPGKGAAATEAPAKAGAEAGAEAGGKATADTGAASKGAADKPAPAAKSPAATGAAGKSAAATKAPVEAGGKATADTDAKTDAGAGAGVKTTADAGTPGKGAAAAKPTDTGTGAKSGAGAKAAADAEATGTKGTAGKPAPAAKPAAGKTPVAPGPEDRPKASSEADAGEEGGKSGGVDQPTTVFKAVQPGKTGVDQPTTMLKLGDAGSRPKPRPAESDAERTSKFVALKDDMRAAAKAAPAKTAAKPAATADAPADATAAVPQVGPELTTQQPLPPKPPLDLLAELTNTPPPPETPVRTLVRRVKIWTPLVLLLVIVFAVVQAFRPLPDPALTLTAEDTYTFDGGRTRLPWPGEGQGWVDADGIGTMDHFGEQKPVAIGSVAKTMTAYIILKDHPLKPGQDGPKIKVDKKAEKEGGYDKDGESTLNTVKAGDHLTEKEALSAVMIPSANNIARLLARWDAGSEAAFVKKMNATARQLGMTGTTYTDPSGLKETTVSTAGDQVKLGRAVVRVPALVAITSAASWTDPSGRNWPNYNELPYRMGAIGIKTGSTTAAGGNLLFASRKKAGGQTVTIVGAILGQNKAPILTTANAVSKTALLAAQSALTSTKVLKKGDVVGYVDDRLGGHTPIVVTKDVTAAGWAGLKVRLSFASGTVPHSAKAGTRVGTLTVGDGSAGAVKVPVALQRDLAEPGFGAKLTRLG
ncbi:D-alanyl-D-alanine carboxypeptidase [Streptomyces sp. NPDC017082]|uniref:D-alanyl-D-alanine carboxypeptidase n=1 Tax=Streptomyces sp. NPDC017082 TaxID=3364974 RepID=UPI0037BCBA79